MMRTTIGLILIFTISLFPSKHIYADNFQDGQDAYDRKDYKTAMEKWKLSAQQEYKGDKIEVDATYTDENGIVKGLKYAPHLIQAYAQHNIAHLYFEGLGVKKNLKEAAKSLLIAAEQGLAESQFSIGTLKKNPKEAAKWFLLAAEQGLAEAQFSIGAMYDFGEGVSQNFVEAEKWYFAAMKQGFIAAAVNLGELARDGKGVIQDYKKAFTMFKLSADYKSAVAHFNLGNAYSKAEGVPKDNVMAIMHYTIASELSEFRIPEAVEEIKALELTLSSDQIIEAQGLAKEWLKKFSKVKTPDSAKFWGYSLDRETFDPIASD